MFGITTCQHIPDEYLYDYTSWDTYMAKIWAALLTDHRLNPNMTVIEIAPGTSIKIGLALQQHAFRGNLYLVEPSKKALDILYKQYQSLLPHAAIYPVQQTLLNSRSALPKRADFVLSNHPLDDMLLAQLGTPSKQTTLFDWALNPSGDISALFLDQWLRYASDDKMLSSAKKQIIQFWQQFFLELDPSITIISQYPSITFQQHQLDAINQHAYDIFNALKSHIIPSNLQSSQEIQPVLNQLENYNNQHIATEVLNAKNWLIRHR